MIASAFCSVLHRRSVSDDFITDPLGHLVGWHRSGLRLQQELGLFPFGHDWSDFDNPDHHDDARQVLRRSDEYASKRS